MPRVQREVERPVIGHPEILEELKRELQNSRAAGQPIIDELVLPKTGALNITVIWDRWDPVPDEERFNIIMRAYDEVETKEFVNRIALAMGLTVPEAIEANLLPYQVTAAWRKTDKVTLEQCREAAIQQGASVLQDPNKPQLRFRTLQEAEACVQRLIAMLPGSESIWTVSKEIVPHT